MSLPPHLRRPEVGDYMYGFAFAVILTLLAFGLAAFAEMERVPLLLAVTVLAIIQAGVHLRYFLHYSTDRTPLEARVALALAILFGAIMIAGSMWVMTDLHYRMMP